MTAIGILPLRVGLLVPVCLIVLCVCIPSLAMAEVYKWVDDEGKINYTQFPPPTGVESETVRQAPSPVVTPVQPGNTLQERVDELEKKQGEAAAASKQKEENAKISKLNCDAATGNLKVLQQWSKRRYMTADGEFHRPTVEEREKLIEEAKQQVKEYCDK